MPNALKMLIENSMAIIKIQQREFHRTQPKSFNIVFKSKEESNKLRNFLQPYVTQAKAIDEGKDWAYVTYLGPPAKGFKPDRELVDFIEATVAQYKKPVITTDLPQRYESDTKQRLTLIQETMQDYDIGYDGSQIPRVQAKRRIATLLEVKIPDIEMEMAGNTVTVRVVALMAAKEPSIWMRALCEMANNQNFKTILNRSLVSFSDESSKDSNRIIDWLASVEPEKINPALAGTKDRRSSNSKKQMLR